MRLKPCQQYGIYFFNMFHGQDAGQLCIGLNTQPFSPNHALLKWTDQSDDALSEIRYKFLFLAYKYFLFQNISIRMFFLNGVIFEITLISVLLFLLGLV